MSRKHRSWFSWHKIRWGLLIAAIGLGITSLTYVVSMSTAFGERKEKLERHEKILDENKKTLNKLKENVTKTGEQVKGLDKSLEEIKKTQQKILDILLNLDKRRRNGRTPR